MPATVDPVGRDPLAGVGDLPAGVPDRLDVAGERPLRRALGEREVHRAERRRGRVSPGFCDAAVTPGSVDLATEADRSRGNAAPRSSRTDEANAMTLATYVEMPTPRRAMDYRLRGPAPRRADRRLRRRGRARSRTRSRCTSSSRRAGTLTHAERMLIVEQALVLLEDNYVHLPLKSAMHAVNPVQRLRLLRARLERQTRRDDGSRADASTRRCRRSSTRSATCTPTTCCPRRSPGRSPTCRSRSSSASRTRAVPSTSSRSWSRASALRVRPGVEVTHWNGMPIERAVDVNADRFAGSNLAARLARGVESLTIRPLRLHLPPDEEWVTVSYLDADGAAPRAARAVAGGPERRRRWPTPSDRHHGGRLAGAGPATPTRSAAPGAAVRPPRSSAGAGSDGRVGCHRTPAGGSRGAVDDAAGLPGPQRGHRRRAPSATCGSSRSTSHDPDAFVAEFVRLVELLPQDGLILDVRGNGGGHIFASEFTLQTLTPRRITPEPVQFICTPLNLEICRQHKDNPTGQIDLGPWFPSMEQAVETGAIYSSAFPITPEDGANAIGQRYFGPVVLITDARCYSATDIFAAGFQDHGIGPVLGVDDNTGAGGANVWTHGLLKALLDVPPDARIARTRRCRSRPTCGCRSAARCGSGALAGTPVEDLGVAPDVRHEMTRRDVLENNVDLLERAGALLAGLPRAAAGPDADLAGRRQA